jgi:hypothetical protein
MIYPELRAFPLWEGLLGAIRRRRGKMPLPQQIACVIGERSTGCRRVPHSSTSLELRHKPSTKFPLPRKRLPFAWRFGRHSPQYIVHPCRTTDKILSLALSYAPIHFPHSARKMGLLRGSQMPRLNLSLRQAVLQGRCLLRPRRAGLALPLQNNRRPA